KGLYYGNDWSAFGEFFLLRLLRLLLHQHFRLSDFLSSSGAYMKQFLQVHSSQLPLVASSQASWPWPSDSLISSFLRDTRAENLMPSMHHLHHLVTATQFLMMTELPHLSLLPSARQDTL